MKVRHLMDALGSFDPEREVFLSIDAEGNDYKPVYSVELIPNVTFEVDPKYPWIVETYQNDDDSDYPEAEQPLVIWPMN